MRVQSCRKILQDFPGCKLGEGKKEILVVTGKEILLDTQGSFPYLQFTQKQLLIHSIIAFGVSHDDERAAMFRKKKFPIPPPCWKGDE
jgi:hypothetical protein